MYDFLFELTEYSENKGKQILCEAPNLEAACTYLTELYGFEDEELHFIKQLETRDGKMLALIFNLNTY